jgi:acetyltransferase-like isoleucine patch superfamily enzyme
VSNDDPRIERLRAQGARIGQNVFFGPDIYIEHDFAPLLTIEDGAVLARGVCVLLHDSALNNVAGAPLKFGRVTLRRNCYIGANATILCGVEVGERAVVGSCALVAEPVPAGSVAYGQPARVRGTVEELVAKHEQLRAEGGRFFYLDLIPWRDRHDDTTAGQRIEAFLRGIVAEADSESHDDE